MLRLISGVATAIAMLIAWFFLLRSSGPIDVFDGVSAADLQSAEVRILDDDPDAQPGWDADQARLRAQVYPGLYSERASLVKVELGAPYYDGIFPPRSGTYLAWAIRVATSQADSGNLAGVVFYPSAEATIAFVDANSGELLRVYTKYPDIPTP